MTTVEKGKEVITHLFIYKVKQKAILCIPEVGRPLGYLWLDTVSI